MAHIEGEDGVDDLVAQVIEEYFLRLKKGEVLELGDYVAKYPEISDLLKTMIPVLQATEQPPVTPASGNASQHQPKQLGDFRILRQIGRGGMGIVYEANQISMNRRVALKVLPLAGLVDELKIRRFQNEVRAVAALDHLNIVPVYMVGEERGVHYYAMRLIRGRSLSEVISSLGQVRNEGRGLDGESVSRITRNVLSDELDAVESEKDAGGTPEPSSPADNPAHGDSPDADTSVDCGDSSSIPHSSRGEYFRCVAALGIQAASALQHAHDQGVVHRDIKPANLLLDGASKLYVTDFGLARIEADAGMTMSGDLVGTLRYMAPEQALAKRVVVDHRADIYSLAATLYELLTLRPAYLAEDRQLLLKKIAFEEPTSLRRIDPNIPTELETIVQKAMSKDMDRRYASAQDLADDLRSHLDNRPISAKPPTTTEIIGKWTRRNPALTWATLVALLHVGLILAASTFLVTSQRNIARSERDAAKQAREKAAAAETEAVARALELERRNYLLHLANADNHLLGRKFQRAEVELDSCSPALRGWEWHFLAKRMRATFPLTLPANSQPIFSDDGRRLIAIGGFATRENHLAITWDLDSGKNVGDAFEHDSGLGFLAVSPNEKWIAGGDREGSLFVWDTESRKKMWSIDVEGGLCNGLAFSPDGRLIASVWERNLMVVVDAASGQVRFRKAFQSDRRKVMFSPDGRWIANGSHLGTEPALLINIETEEIVKFSEAGGNMLPTFAPDGQSIATANVDSSIKLWPWDGKRLGEPISWPNAGRMIRCLAFDADGTRLVSASKWPCTVKVWDIDANREIASLDNAAAVWWSTFSPRSQEVALGCREAGIRLWHYGETKSGQTFKALNGVVDAKFSPEGKLILASTPMYWSGAAVLHGLLYEAESAAFLDANSGDKVGTIDEPIYAASWSPDGQQVIATIASGDAIRTYDVATGAPLPPDFPGIPGRTTISKVDPLRRRLVSFSSESTLRVFDLQANARTSLPDIRAKKTQIGGLGADFSSDAKLIGIGGNDRLEIWDSQNLKLIGRHSQPGHWAKKFEFSSDGNCVYIGWNDGLLTAFDIPSGKETKRFLGHFDQVRAIAIAPNEQQIVAGDNTGQVIVWDVPTQLPLVTLIARGQLVVSLDWSSDGRRIVAGKEDGTVQVWTLPISQ